MTKYCPKCGKTVSDDCNICPNCHEYIPSIKTDYVSYDTSMSGEHFSVSSGTYVSPSFTEIADKFEGDPTLEVTIDPLITDNIDKDTLKYYVEIGYLERMGENKFKLTDLGKEVFLKNREFRQKVKDNIKDIDFD